MTPPESEQLPLLNHRCLPCLVPSYSMYKKTTLCSCSVCFFMFYLACSAAAGRRCDAFCETPARHSILIMHQRWQTQLAARQKAQLLGRSVCICEAEHCH